jgi:hypothetical protein
MSISGRCFAPAVLLSGEWVVLGPVVKLVDAVTPLFEESYLDQRCDEHVFVTAPLRADTDVLCGHVGEDAGGPVFAGVEP